MTENSQKAILFLGATGGCGLSALHRSLDAGYACITLCQTPTKLIKKLGFDKVPENLRIEIGNAKDAVDLISCLQHPFKSYTFVDVIFSSIGGAPQIVLPRITVQLDDSHICDDGLAPLLEGLAILRGEGFTGRPRIIFVSSTSPSKLERDIPLPMAPFYWVFLGIPHKYKGEMERRLFSSEEDFTVVRASRLVDAPESRMRIQEGIEEPGKNKVDGTSAKGIGYTISKEDVGKWIFQNLIRETRNEWARKVATVTN